MPIEVSEFAVPLDWSAIQNGDVILVEREDCWYVADLRAKSLILRSRVGVV